MILNANLFESRVFWMLLFRRLSSVLSDAALRAYAWLLGAGFLRVGLVLARLSETHITVSTLSQFLGFCLCLCNVLKLHCPFLGDRLP